MIQAVAADWCFLTSALLHQLLFLRPVSTSVSNDRSTAAEDRPKAIDILALPGIVQVTLHEFAQAETFIQLAHQN
jgi:hypothetical protein